MNLQYVKLSKEANFSLKRKLNYQGGNVGKVGICEKGWGGDLVRL